MLSHKIIIYLFCLLFFLTPLVMYPGTSEIFEFNKITLLYIFALLITSIWFIKTIKTGKLVFRRTLLDIPLILFILSQSISTILSIDQRTSLFGYYSRFNGGLASTIAYSLIYWSFVSNIKFANIPKFLKLTLYSSFAVCIYAILQKMGVDKNFWVQDVQNRVFSSVGQPNWLAAWLAAIIPLTLAFLFKNNISSKMKLFWILVFIFQFSSLLFTKSRSGIMGFTVSFLIFGFLIFRFYSHKISKFSKNFVLVGISILFISLIFGTPWTPGISDLFSKPKNPVLSQEPALEAGGTESGNIRKIVWRGAIDIWKQYPIFGSGVETFAYSYYQKRPAGHNLVSEWDFLYNKAHNEYLNYLSTTGILGLFTYLLLIATGLVQINKALSSNKKKFENWDIEPGFIKYSLLSGYLSILLTNIFGFSVVLTSALIFLYPAISVILQDNGLKEYKLKLPQILRWIFLLFISICAVFIAFFILRMWLSDIYYARGKYLNNINKYEEARIHLNRAILLNSKEPNFYNEISKSALGLALKYNKEEDSESYQFFAKTAVEESAYAVSLSPRNMNIRRNYSATLVKLSEIEPGFLAVAAKSLQDAISLAPTDAKLYYNLAVIYAQQSMIDESLNTLKQTINLKTNYKDARYALAVILNDTGEKEEAAKQLEYILTNIDPKDVNTKNLLKEISEDSPTNKKIN